MEKIKVKMFPELIESRFLKHVKAEFQARGKEVDAEPHRLGGVRIGNPFNRQETLLILNKLREKIRKTPQFRRLEVTDETLVVEAGRQMFEDKKQLAAIKIAQENPKMGLEDVKRRVDGALKFQAVKPYLWLKAKPLKNKLVYGSKNR